jgi:sugar phosphate isomerase/epimerase
MTRESLAEIAGRIERGQIGARIALELRHAKPGTAPWLDTSRSGMLEIVGPFLPKSIGICWDLGHDGENGRSERDWRPAPPRDFLDRVIHVHAHDAGPDGAVHYPLTTHRVPIAEQVHALIGHGYTGSITLEIRYRYAAALGDPWEMMRRSHERMTTMIRRAHSRKQSAMDGRYPDDAGTYGRSRT